LVSIDEQILRATKEIVAKFIEAGRVSPTGLHETFRLFTAPHNPRNCKGLRRGARTGKPTGKLT